MIEALLVSPPAWLQAADTVVAVFDRGPLDTVSAWADVILAVVMVLFVAGLTVFLFEIRKINRTVRILGRDALRRADPVLDRTRTVAANVEFISAAVRTDVERLSSQVRTLGDRLQQASDRMEERIEEFNALMEVVQDEAEDLFVDTAATVRGVRAGARSLGDGRASGRRPPLTSPAGGVEGDERARAGAVYATGAGEDRAAGRGDGDEEAPGAPARSSSRDPVPPGGSRR